jgi:hypothetical protein
MRAYFAMDLAEVLRAVRVRANKMLLGMPRDTPHFGSGESW